MKPGVLRGGIVMVLPASENFSPDRAGAIAMVVSRHAAAAGATVIGGDTGGTIYPGIDYAAIPARSPLGYNIGVIRRLRALGPAIIEIHQQPRLARIAARLLPGARVMLFLHNDPLTMRGLRRPAQRASSLASLHRVICVSGYLADRFMTGLAAGPHRPAILPNPLDLAALPRPAAERLPSPAADRSKIILFAGRIVETKGIADFIAACASALPALQGWSVRIIGGDRFGPQSRDTPYVTDMRAAALAHGFGWAGYQPHATVLAAMADAAIVVVPSRWPEPFGLTALEAMASGAALIATSTGGLPEVIEDGGVLVPPGDVAALSHAITGLATDDIARATLAKRARARAATFDTKLIAARLQALRDA